MEPSEEPGRDAASGEQGSAQGNGRGLWQGWSPNRPPARTWLSVNTRKSRKSGRGDLGRGAAAACTRVPVIDTHLDAGKLPMRLRDAGRQQTASMTPGRGGGVGSPRGAPPPLGEGWRRRALAGGVTAACHSQWRKCCSREGRRHLPGALGRWHWGHAGSTSQRTLPATRGLCAHVCVVWSVRVWGVRGLCVVCATCAWRVHGVLYAWSAHAHVWAAAPFSVRLQSRAGSATVWLLNKRDSAKSESAVVT